MEIYDVSIGDKVRRNRDKLIAAIVNRRLRSQWVTRLTAGRKLHQDVVVTKPNRYPKLFAGARALLGDAPRILSFGCSSGEEVISLREYFPGAQIVGAEINKAMLADCRRLLRDPGTRFIHSSHARIAKHGPYDAIFAMAVFQRRPHWVETTGLRDLSDHYPFALFADEIAFLTGQLAPGGLLIVEHAQYRVEDIADLLLEAVPGDGTFPARGPRFGPNGRILPSQPVVSRIFRKL